MQNKAAIAAVIFDMDGLLIDSEPLWCQAQVDIFRAHNFDYEAPDCLETVGIRVDQSVAYWYEQRGWQGPPAAEITRQIIERTIALIASEGRAMPGALDTVHFFRRRNLPIAVASSSPHNVIAANIRALGLQGCFQVVCSAEGERYGKPHPAVYINAADQLGVDRRQCLVFEDSLAGVIAAKAAEMTCVCVPDGPLKGDKRLGIADCVLDSLAAFDERLWRQINGSGR